MAVKLLHDKSSRKYGTASTSIFALLNGLHRCYLRCFSESRSSSGFTPPVCLSISLSATFLGFLVCVICNSKSFDSFLFKLCIMTVNILKMCTSYFVHI